MSKTQDEESTKPLKIKTGRETRLNEPQLNLEEKVIKKLRSVIKDKPDTYFLVGTHHQWGTYMIISLIYPRKKYIESRREEDKLSSFT